VLSWKHFPASPAAAMTPPPATRGTPPPLDPVPDWLANRLIHTAGVSPEKVAALGLEPAVDLWTAFVSGPGR
jgi:hypothetical protein